MDFIEPYFRTTSTIEWCEKDHHEIEMATFSDEID